MARGTLCNNMIFDAGYLYVISDIIVLLFLVPITFKPFILLSITIKVYKKHINRFIFYRNAVRGTKLL